MNVLYYLGDVFLAMIGGGMIGYSLRDVVRSYQANRFIRSRENILSACKTTREKNTALRKIRNQTTEALRRGV